MIDLANTEYSCVIVIRNLIKLFIKQCISVHTQINESMFTESTAIENEPLIVWLSTEKQLSRKSWRSRIVYRKKKYRMVEWHLCCIVDAPICHSKSTCAINPHGRSRRAFVPAKEEQNNSLKCRLWFLSDSCRLSQMIDSFYGKVYTFLETWVTQLFVIALSFLCCLLNNTVLGFIAKSHISEYCTCTQAIKHVYNRTGLWSNWVLVKT